MRLADVDGDTEATFLRCLHDEKPDDPRVTRLRRRWFDAHRDRGLRARVLVLDTGEVAGLCQYIPIEHTHVVGEDMLVILCMWVHGYDHHIGNRQGNGYGRYMLESIERDARESGGSGLVAWGMDFPYWNPVSFYEHMGYSRVDKSGMAVLVWKPFREGVSPPRYLRQARRPAGDPSKVSVMVFLNGWCTGSCSQCVTAREAVEGLEESVDYREVDASDPEALRSWGISDGLYVEGEPYRPYEPPCTCDVLRQDLLELAKNGRGGEGGAAV
jgi:GNAT superfamily N-acetyltransferase